MCLLTTRDGLAATAGHDLKIEVGIWSAELDVADDLSFSALAVRADLTSMIVRAGTGGLKPLTERDKREIALTARKVLGADRHPEAAFSAKTFEPGTAGGGVIAGTLTIAGMSRPVRLDVTKTGADGFHASTTIRQSDFGIKPYSAFLGALKVSDAVKAEVDVDLAGEREGGSP